MKKMLMGLFVMICLLLPTSICAKDLTIYLFHGETCPHCKEEIEYLNRELTMTYPGVNVKLYEVWYHEENEILKQNVQLELDSHSTGVPFTVIGKTVLTGFDDNTKIDIEKAVIDYLEHPKKYEDIVAKVLKNGVSKQEPIDTDIKDENTLFYQVPILGEVNGEELDLISFGAILGGISSFHPYVFIFLLLILYFLSYVEDDETKWRSIFIVSAVISFVFLFMMTLFSQKEMLSFFKGFVPWVPYLFLVDIIGIFFLRKKDWKSLFSQKRFFVFGVIATVSFASILYFLGTRTSAIGTLFEMMKVQAGTVSQNISILLAFTLVFFIGTILLQAILLFMTSFLNEKHTRIFMILLALVTISLSIFTPQLFTFYF